jgi:hypothetical protein
MQIGIFARIGFLTIASMAAEPAFSQSPPAEDPIVVMPLAEIEPPRNVPAAEWKSPYCAKWDDGCTECTRTSADAPATCKPAADYIGGGTCKPRGVLCATSISHDNVSELARVCWRQAWVSVSRPGVTGIPPATFALSGFSRDADTGRWYDDSIPLLAADGDEFARRTMRVIGRDPDGEFGLTDRKFVATLLCLRARKVGGGGQGAAPEWLRMENGR